LKLILDTSFLIALKRGDKAARRLLEERRGRAEDIGISRLSQYELLVGALYMVKKYGDVRELAWINEALRWLTIYEVEKDVIETAARVKSESILKGEDLPDLDLLIALSGKENSELLTLDEDQIKMAKYLAKYKIIVSHP